MSKSDFDLNYQNQNIESKIVASFERISQSFRVLLWKESKAFSLSPIQIQILIFLLHHSIEKRKVSYLANEFNLTKATISDTIKTLEQKKLITKNFEENDTRSYIINLSSKGKLIAEKTSLFSNEISKPINQLTNEQKESMLQSMFEIIKHLNKSGIITVQRMCQNCKYYQSSKNNTEHFCNLLNQKLQLYELRVDCPEHIMKE